MVHPKKPRLAADAPALSRFRRGDATAALATLPAPTVGLPEPHIWEPRYAPEVEVRAIVGNVSGMTLRRWSADPEIGFPRSTKLGPGAKAWNYWWLPDIGAWVAKARERDRQRRETAAQKPKRRVGAKRLEPAEAGGGT
jgi:hypothetical protein